MQNGAHAYVDTHRQKRRWLVLLACMAAVVALCTMCALMMPASTLETKTVCGTEEHSHDSSCYEATLICGQEEDSTHAHDESCYEDALVCDMTEHTHTDACYASDDDATEDGEESEDSDAATLTAAALPDGAEVPEGYTEQYTVQDEENGYTVTVYAAEGVVPEGATLSATLLSESDDAYAAAEEALAAEEADGVITLLAEDADEDSSYGFAALDIHFEDADGNEVEPEGDVYVVIDAADLLPEDADTDTVTVQHHAESDGDVTVETVADAADETDGVVAVTDDTTVQAAFTVESFSTFTIRWGSNYGNSLTVYYGTYANGQVSELNVNVPGSNSSVNVNSSITISGFNAPSVSGYSYTGTAYIVTTSGSGWNQTTTTTPISYLRYNNGSWQYSTNGSNWQNVGNGRIYFIYSSTGGSSGGSSGGNETDTDANVYDSSARVYWDEADFANSAPASNTHVTSVTLGNQTIAMENSATSSWSTSTATLSSCFPGVSANDMDDATLTITVADGYYVSRVVVVCWPGVTGSGTTTPYDCSTWSSENAFDQPYEISADGSFSIDISSLYFSHTSNEQNTNPVYFILIETTPIPSPLYVEYDYGAIDEILDTTDSTVFATANGWVTASTSNNYGTGNVATANTQFVYAYEGENSAEAASWTHVANTVTEEAKKAAAEAGYYFAGWYAEYYTECTSVDNESGAYNNYTYTFSNESGAEGAFATATYSEGDTVRLFTNVKLTAIWLPIELKVTKTVEGLDDSLFGNSEATYTMTLQKLTTSSDGSDTWETVADNISVTVTGNGTATVTLKGTEYYDENGKLLDSDSVTESDVTITPGTYRVVEDTSESSGISTRTVTTNNGTVTYHLANVTYEPESITISTDTILGTSTTSSQTNYSLKVTNKYSEEEPTADLTILKTDSDGATKLEGAQFQLYYTVETTESGDDDNEVTTETKYYYQEQTDTDGNVTEVKWVSENEISATNQPTTLTSDSDDGTLTFKDLDTSKTYYLVETKAPDGYQLLTEAISISWDTSGNLVAYKGSTALTDIDQETSTITVTNTTGAELPSTGGAGTTYLTISGLLLVAIAVGGGFATKRLRRRGGAFGR